MVNARSLAPLSLVALFLAALLACDSKKPATPGPAKGSNPPPPARKDFTLALVGRGVDDEVSTIVVRGFLRAADEFASANDLTVTTHVHTPSRRGTRAQIDAVRAASDRIPDAVVAFPDEDGLITVDDRGRPSPDGVFLALVSQLDAARSAGADVLLVGTDFIGSDRIGYVGWSEAAAGRAAGETLASAMGGAGKAVILAGTGKRAEHVERAEAAAAALASAGVTAVVVNHEEQALDAALAGHADLQGVLIATGASLASIPAGVKVVTIDASTPALQALSRGEIHAVIAGDYDAWGRAAAIAILERVHAGKFPAETHAEALVLTRGNAADFLAKWTSWLAAPGG